MGSPLTTIGSPINSFDLGDDIRCCEFIPGTDDIMVGLEDDKTYVVSGPSYNSKTLDETYTDKVNDIAFRKNSTHYIAGLEDDHWVSSEDLAGATNLGNKVKVV